MLSTLTQLVTKAPYGELKNNLKEPIFDVSKMPGSDYVKNFFDTMDTFNENLKIIFHFIGDVGYILGHPEIILKYSFSVLGIVCIIIVCAGTIAYALGHKKAGLWVQGSIAGYIIMKMIGIVL